MRINETCNCGSKATAIIRTHNVCWRCFRKLKTDNLERIKKGIDIPNTLELLE